MFLVEDDSILKQVSYWQISYRSSTQKPGRRRKSWNDIIHQALECVIAQNFLDSSASSTRDMCHIAIWHQLWQQKATDKHDTVCKLQLIIAVQRKVYLAFINWMQFHKCIRRCWKSETLNTLKDRAVNWLHLAIQSNLCYYFLTFGHSVPPWIEIHFVSILGSASNELV